MNTSIKSAAFTKLLTNASSHSTVDAITSYIDEHTKRMVAIATATRGHAPYGWRIVPNHPTAQMIAAAKAQLSEPYSAYVAMLRAAPSYQPIGQMELDFTAPSK